MAHTCRGTINLCTAHFDKEDSCGIMLTNGARTYHLKASSEVERQHWITTLELAKAKAVHLMSSHSGPVTMGGSVPPPHGDCATGAPNDPAPL
uniref:Oxysterol binding protein 2 n=1 Tax=Equus caballus TaxID=9796 RepID=A0A3Q2I9T0_HORSE